MSGKRMKTRKYFLFTAAVISLALVCCSCTTTPFSPVREREDPADGQYVIDISPADKSEAYDSVRETLYFRLGSEDLLAPMMVGLDLAVDQTREEAVITALLNGPSGNHELSGVIPEGTKLVSVKSQHGYLEVTLSSDFFDVPKDAPKDWQSYESWRSEINRARLLATYSIVNSITEMGVYSNVLILIDTNSDGNGQRVDRSLFGIEVDSEAEPIEPLGRDTSLILTPIKAAQIVLDAQKAQDTDTIARYVYFAEGTPSAQTLKETLLSDITISSYDLLSGGGAVTSLDGQSAVITLDYETIVYGSQRQSTIGVPLKMVLDDNIWKVDYESLCAMVDK